MNTPESRLPNETDVNSGVGDSTVPKRHPLSIPTPGVSEGVMRVPTSPTLPDPRSKTYESELSALATSLYGVEGEQRHGPGRKGSHPQNQITRGGIVPKQHGFPEPQSPSIASHTNRAHPPSNKETAPFFLQSDAVSSDRVKEKSSPYGNEMAGSPSPFHREVHLPQNLDELSTLQSTTLNFKIPVLDSRLDESEDIVPKTNAAPTLFENQSDGFQNFVIPNDLSGITSLERSTVSGQSFYDPVSIRNQFPLLNKPVNGKRLIWLDNAATTQKPQTVIDRISTYYENENSNIHRAAHTLAARSTEAYEQARKSVQRFINAPSDKNIVFVRGATEGINLIAQSFGQAYIKKGDEILISWLEHHANIVPWQELCKKTGAILRVAPVDDRGQIILEEYERLLSEKTKIVSVTHVSNALGTVTPIKTITGMAHRVGAVMIVDAAQSVSHHRVDVQSIDCDFLVFSGHKVFAPTGIGAVYGKKHILESMQPWQTGGNMIQDVTFEKTSFNPPPAKFEAGTGNIADAVGLGAALDWLTQVGIESVASHEAELLNYASKELSKFPKIAIIGSAKEKAGVISFVFDGYSPQEVASHLDKDGIAVRGGHHCAQPIIRRLGHEGTVRPSFGPYNTIEDVDLLMQSLRKLR